MLLRETNFVRSVLQTRYDTLSCTTYVAGGEDHGLEYEQRDPLMRDGTRRPMLAVHIPKVAFVEQGKQWMDVKKVLLYKLVEHRSRRHTEAALGLEVVHVLRKDVRQVADIQKGIVRVYNVGGKLRQLLRRPGVHRGAGSELRSRRSSPDTWIDVLRSLASLWWS